MTLFGGGLLGMPNSQFGFGQQQSLPTGAPANVLSGRSPMMTGAPISAPSTPLAPPPGLTPGNGSPPLAVPGLQPQLPPPQMANGAPVQAAQTLGLFGSQAPRAGTNSPGLNYATQATNPIAAQWLHGAAHSGPGMNFSPQGLQQLFQGYGHEIAGAGNTLSQGVMSPFHQLFGAGQGGSAPGAGTAGLGDLNDPAVLSSLAALFA